MASQSEGLVIGDVILLEGDMHYSRETLTLATSQIITLGEILEPDSANVKALAVAANATAIALEAVTTTTATAEILCLVRHGIVNQSNLGYNAQAAAATNAALKALGIVVRDEPATVEEA